MFFVYVFTSVPYLEFVVLSLSWFDQTFRERQQTQDPFQLVFSHIKLFDILMECCYNKLCIIEVNLSPVSIIHSGDCHSDDVITCNKLPVVIFYWSLYITWVKIFFRIRVILVAQKVIVIKGIPVTIKDLILFRTVILCI